MPRTVFDAQKHKYDKLLALILGTATVAEKTYEDIGGMIGCTKNTITARFKHPENLTLGELTRIGRGLNIPIDDLRQSIQY
ncbi:MAG: hypothetical protein GX488_11640 [Clostridiales bacterium]|nr:hypothetical protein [Clostridiales bacterium]